MLMKAQETLALILIIIYSPDQQNLFNEIKFDDSNLHLMTFREGYGAKLHGCERNTEEQFNDYIRLLCVFV